MAERKQFNQLYQPNVQEFRKASFDNSFPGTVDDKKVIKDIASQIKHRVGNINNSCYLYLLLIFMLTLYFKSHYKQRNQYSAIAHKRDKEGL